MRVDLTPEEARVLHTFLLDVWAPVRAYQPFRSAVQKIGRAANGEVCCRDCSNSANIPHRLGGFVCRSHAPSYYREPLPIYGEQEIA